MREPQLRVCTGSCNRMTRTSNMSINEFPDTVVRVKEGRCATCNRAKVRGSDVPPRPVRGNGQRYSEAGVAQARAADEIFQRERAARLARAEQARLRNQMSRFRGTGMPPRGITA